MNVLAPEGIELNKKKRILERFKETLAFREEAMTELRAELEQFEAQYKMEVGRFYAELDEIEAQIAEEEVKLVPDDEEIKKRAEELRRRAEESAANTENAENCSFKWQPTAEAKKAYHNLAKIIHPDLALDAEEKEKRHNLMTRLNDAYSAGDQNLLNKLVEDFRDSPDLVRGDSIGDELVRVIRQIYQIKNRLKELREELLKAELSELFTLHAKVRAEMLEGRNLLKQMAERTKTHIKKSERRLANLRNLNQAQEEYVNERFGMDISAFR
ncbi:MAG: J domain-containing protein [Acidobacteria bacterium]|nr:J domain-containing protein [Acidobacteriota bacterium]MCA1639679.1 J domain-containing protein [Acidobacteriota bacterium]